MSNVRFTLARVLDPEDAQTCHNCNFYKTHKIYTHREKGKSAEESGAYTSSFWPVCDKCLQEITEDWLRSELKARGKC